MNKLRKKNNDFSIVTNLAHKAERLNVKLAVKVTGLIKFIWEFAKERFTLYYKALFYVRPKPTIRAPAGAERHQTNDGTQQSFYFIKWFEWNCRRWLCPRWCIKGKKHSRELLWWL